MIWIVLAAALGITGAFWGTLLWYGISHGPTDEQLDRFIHDVRRRF